MIEIQNLGKDFSLKQAGGRWWQKSRLQTVHAVSNLSFTIDKGQAVAFIGPNGAGKSTTLKMLSGILTPSYGSATVAGLTPWTQRQQLARHIGLVFGQRSQLIAELPVRDALSLIGALYDTQVQPDTLPELIERFNLGDLTQRPVRSLSLGQRMRVEIAASLLHKPKVLFLDEPTIGLDVTAKAELRDLLKQLVQDEQITLLLTSHDPGDIEEICGRVILINFGRLLDDLSLSAMRQRYFTEKRITLQTIEAQPKIDIGQLPVRAQHIIAPHQLQLIVEPKQEAIQTVVNLALSQLQVVDIVISDPPLDEILRQIYAAAHHA